MDVANSEKRKMGPTFCFFLISLLLLFFYIIIKNIIYCVGGVAVGGSVSLWSGPIYVKEREKRRDNEAKPAVEEVLLTQGSENLSYLMTWSNWGGFPIHSN
jgi:hypothetical protein